MSTITRVAKAMQRVLTEEANEAAEKTGFVKRERKFSGASFVQTLTFGWLSKGDASLGELNQAAAAVGVEISQQGIDKRFGPEAAECMRQVLEAAMEEVIKAEPATIPILQRFNGVHLLDSSTIGLPEKLAEIWPGCNSNQGKTAALKIQVDINYSNGSLHKLWLQAGRKHDQCEQAQSIELPKGALRIADLGYFKLEWLKNAAKNGVFWLSRLKTGTNLYTVEGQVLELGTWLTSQKTVRVDMPIRMGAKHQIQCRLLAERVPPTVAAERRRKLKRNAQKKGQTLSKVRLALADWTLLITNLSAEQLSLEEALVLYRVRWQIELLFKLWKSVGLVDESRSQNPWRVLCEVYAKLLAMIIQHWIFLTGFWMLPNRSLTKAAQTVQKYAFSLALLCNKSKRLLVDTLSAINRCLLAGCRINSRHHQPNTYQLLLEFDA